MPPNSLPTRCKCFNQTLLRQPACLALGVAGWLGDLSITQMCKVLDRQQDNAQGRQRLLAQAQTGLILCSTAQELCGNNQSFQLKRVGFGVSLWSLHAQLHPRPSCCQGMRVLRASSAEALGQPCLHQQQQCGVLGWEREGQKSPKNQRVGEAGK